MGRSSPFLSRKSNKQEKQVKYQSIELKWSRFNFKWNTCGRRWGGCDRENHYNYNSMMPPDGGGGGGGGVRQGGIDLLLLYRDTRQVLSDPPPPPHTHTLSLSFPLSPSKVGLFPDLSDLGETARQSTPVFQLGLSPSPSPLGRSFLWSLIFSKSSSLHS